MVIYVCNGLFAQHLVRMRQFCVLKGLTLSPNRENMKKTGLSVQVEVEREHRDWDDMKALGL